MFEDFSGGKVVVINDRGLLHLDMVKVLTSIKVINGWSEQDTEDWWLTYTMSPKVCTYPNTRIEREPATSVWVYEGMLISAFIYDDAMMEANPELALEALNEENL